MSSEHADVVDTTWLESDLGQIDFEIARLATLCQVRLLDPDVIERILEKDATVCGASNPVAFAKLHDLVRMHFAVRHKVSDAFGPAETERITAHIVEDLRKRFSDALARYADRSEF